MAFEFAPTRRCVSQREPRLLIVRSFGPGDRNVQRSQHICVLSVGIRLAAAASGGRAFASILVGK